MTNEIWDWLSPEISTNYVKNPVASNSTTDWAIAGGTSGGALSVDTTPGNILFDQQVVKFTGTLVGSGRGPQVTLSQALANATTQVQVWCYGATPTAIILGSTSSAPTTLRTEGVYTVYGATFTGGQASGQTTAQAGFAAGALTVYVYIQVEQSSTYTTFIWGDGGPGYIWNGADGQSSSTRYIFDPDGKIVYGGSITAIDDRVNVVCEAMVGVGLLPYTVESQSLAGETPALYVKHDLKPRDIILSIAVSATSMANAHSRRAALLALWPYGREGWLRYNGAGTVLQIRVAVSGQFDPDLSKSRLARKANVQFTAQDPKFQAIYQDTTALTFSSSPTSSYVQLRTDAAGWGAMNSGLFAPPRRMIQGPDGTFYCGTLASGGTAKLQKWTGTAWSDVQSVTGSITAGPVIYDLVPNADWTKLYILGDYTTVGGVAGFGGVAAITLADGTAAKLGAGVSAGGAPLCGSYVLSLSRLYVGGLFAGMNSVANTGYYCYWDGAAWQSVGTTRPTGGVYCMVNDGNDNLILGGDFTNTFPLAAISAPTITEIVGGGTFSANTNYWVWVIPCDGTNFNFNPATLGYTTGYGRAIPGTAAIGPAQRAIITTGSGSNTRQFQINWTAVPGALYYIIWIGDIQYGDGATSLASGPMIDVTQYAYELFGRGSLGARWTNVNGTMTYDTSYTNARYAPGALKYTGTSLAANSGCVHTPGGSYNAGTWQLGAWVKGGAPDKFGRYTSGSWTYTSAPTAYATDGAWTYYAVSTTSAATFTATGVFFSGTGTWYVGYYEAKLAAASSAPYVKSTPSFCYVVPASMTSVNTSQLLSYISPDAPTSIPFWPPVQGSPWVIDRYTEEGTGAFGSRIIKHRPVDGSWERMAQPGGGFNAVVRSLCWVGGALVAGGDFTLADNAAANRVAYTRGKAWLPVGISGMPSGSVYRLTYYNGTLWAVGSFPSADGDTSAALVARMDGFPTGGWTHTDLALTNSSNNAYDVLVLPYRVILADDTNYSSASATTSVAYSGTGNLYPRIVVTGPGFLRWIENGLTKARLIFNYTLQAGEVLTIDCQNAIVKSNFQGDITDLLQISSNLDGFYIAASTTQTMFVHMTGTTVASSISVQGNKSYITGDV